MILVIFEVVIKKEYMDKYLDLAKNIKDELIKSEGFIRSERFLSVVDERKLLSLSVWENEDSITKWRNVIKHRAAQMIGREEMFESYTITVTQKIRSYTNENRLEAPKDSNEYFNTK